MSTEHIKNVGVEFALTVRFLTLIHRMNLPADVLQRAIDNADHPLWKAVSRALSPDGSSNPISDETSLVLSRRFTLFIDSLRLPEGVAVAATKVDHPLWDAVRNAMLPEEMPMSSGLTIKKKGDEEGAQAAPTLTDASISRIQILTERPKPCANRSIDEQVTDLKQMYQALRWTWTEHGLVVPVRQKGFDRLLVFVDTGFTNNRLYDVCNASFPCWRYVGDLDLAVSVDTDERHPSRGAYAIWVKDAVGGDHNSAKVIAQKNLPTATLLERVFLELVYYRETGEHLDIETGTRCSGSRDLGGYVPYATSRGGMFEVDSCNLDEEISYIRARQVATM